MPQTPHVETHFTSSEKIRDIVIGMSDGLTVPFALAAGLSGVVESTGIVMTAGLAEVAAGAIAMGLGGYLAARTDAEHYVSEYGREKRETFEVPEVETEEVASLFRSYGLPETTVTSVAGQHGGRARRIRVGDRARATGLRVREGYLHGQEALPQCLADGGRRGAGGRGGVYDREADCVDPGRRRTLFVVLLVGLSHVVDEHRLPRRSRASRHGDHLLLLLGGEVIAEIDRTRRA
jgi:VIT1/CCC1 family predicted Fe2+/Mn2+ transporter